MIRCVRYCVMEPDGCRPSAIKAEVAEFVAVHVDRVDGGFECLGRFIEVIRFRNGEVVRSMPSAWAPPPG